MPASRDKAKAALKRLLDDHPEIDAICAYNDEIAFAVLAAAHDAGIGVPERLSVIGIDNHPYGGLSIPALTTVESDVSEFVEAFAAHVVNLVGGSSEASVFLPDTARVIPRLSS